MDLITPEAYEQLPEYDLTLDEIYTWLRSLSPYETVGVCTDEFNCAVTEYVSHNRLLKAKFCPVDRGSQCWVLSVYGEPGEGKVDYRVKPEVGQFAYQFDALGDWNADEMSAGEVLDGIPEALFRDEG